MVSASVMALLSRLGSRSQFFIVVHLFFLVLIVIGWRWGLVRVLWWRTIKPRVVGWTIGFMAVRRPIAVGIIGGTICVTSIGRGRRVISVSPVRHPRRLVGATSVRCPRRLVRVPTIMCRGRLVTATAIGCRRCSVCIVLWLIGSLESRRWWWLVAVTLVWWRRWLI